jgi:hypothetical protein
VAFGLLLGVVLVRDALGAIAVLAGLPRSRVAAAVAVLAAALWSLGHQPALAARLSPKQAFVAYEREAKADEELALLGLSPSAGAHQLGRTLPNFRDASGAFRWFASADEGRRFFVFKRRYLAELNSMHRGLFRSQLQVLAEPSADILLACTDLGTRPSDNPLNRYFRDEAPAVARKLGAVLDDRVEIVGWEVLDASGSIVEQLSARRPYVMRVVYVVRAPAARWLRRVLPPRRPRSATQRRSPAARRAPIPRSSGSRATCSSTSTPSSSARTSAPAPTGCSSGSTPEPRVCPSPKATTATIASSGARSRSAEPRIWTVREWAAESA